jgi:hypothetical protein
MEKQMFKVGRTPEGNAGCLRTQEQDANGLRGIYLFDLQGKVIREGASL